MPVKKHHSTKHQKKTSAQTVLQFQEPAMSDGSGSESLAHYEFKLEPIVDKKTYDSFLKAIALRIYSEFERTLKGEGIDRPELSLVGLDLKKAATPVEIRMAEYVALNARLIVDRAFVDIQGYAHTYMPRAFREMEADKSSEGDIVPYVELKIQRDLVMEIRTIAMLHIPDAERFSYVSKLKEL
nr:hypothetical protein [Methanocella arvoryzae]